MAVEHSIGEIDAFMKALARQESGDYTAWNGSGSGAYGKYQMIRGTFLQGARLAGVSTAWPPGPEAQEAAARALVERYFSKYGDWRQVSAAWYAGEGWADKNNWSQGRQNQSYAGDSYPSIANYANSVVAGMDGADIDATGSPPSEEDLMEEIRADYPEYAFLLDDPEIRAILLEAVDPLGGLDDAKFMARIRETEWYQTTGRTARSWEWFKQSDPASAKRRFDQEYLSIVRQAQGMGVRASDQELRELTERALKFGFTPQELSAEFARLLIGDEPAGRVASVLTELRGMASGYLTPVSEQELVRWAQGIVTGSRSFDDYEKLLRDLAKAKFVGNEQLTKIIDQGVSPDAFFSSHRQMLADEWGLAPDQVDLNDDRWAGIISSKNDQGVFAPMSVDEARKYSRSVEGWDQTKRGQDAIASVGLNLLRKWGLVKT